MEGGVQFLKRLYLGGGEAILKMYTIHEGSGTIFKTENCIVVNLLFNCFVIIEANPNFIQ